MVRIKEKKEIDAVRNENELWVEYKYEWEGENNEELENVMEVDCMTKQKILNDLIRIKMDTGRSLFNLEEIEAILNSYL